MSMTIHWKQKQLVEPNPGNHRCVETGILEMKNHVHFVSTVSIPAADHFHFASNVYKA